MRVQPHSLSFVSLIVMRPLSRPVRDPPPLPLLLSAQIRPQHGADHKSCFPMTRRGLIEIHNQVQLISWRCV